MRDEDHRLTEEEKSKVREQVDYFIYLLSEKYGTKPHEIAEAIQWVNERREFVKKLKSSGMMGLLGLIITGMMIALWEGVLSLMRRG